MGGLVLANVTGIVDTSVPGVDQNPLSDTDNLFPGSDGEPALDVNATEDAVFEQVNHIRSSQRLSPLEADEALRAVAVNHSRDMVERDFFAHENPDGDGPWDRVVASEANCGGAGENLAMTWYDKPIEDNGSTIGPLTTPEEIANGLVNQWMGSPGHRENILKEGYVATGVGVVVTDEGEVFATQLFCL